MLIGPVVGSFRPQGRWLKQVLGSLQSPHEIQDAATGCLVRGRCLFCTPRHSSVARVVSWSGVVPGTLLPPLAMSPQDPERVDQRYGRLQADERQMQKQSYTVDIARSAGRLET